MPIKIDNTTISSTGGDTVTHDDAASISGYLKVGDASESASTAGAGALKYSSKILLSNGSSWLPIYLERDGTSNKPVWYPSDLSDVYSSDQSLYVNPAGRGDLVQYTLDFTTPGTPKYQVSGTNSGVCVSTSGSVGGCSQGTGASYDIWSAASYCMKAGLRLCSKANLGDATGSGCGHDSRGIWTTDQDSNGDFWVGQGNSPTTGGWYDPDYTGSFSGFSTNEIGIRCCGSGSNDSIHWTLER